MIMDEMIDADLTLDPLLDMWGPPADEAPDPPGPCRAKETPRPRESLVAVREYVDSDLPVGSEPTVHLTGRVVGHRDGLLTLAVTLADGTEDIVTVDRIAAGVSGTVRPPR